MDTIWSAAGLDTKPLLGPVVLCPVPVAVEALAHDWDWLWLDDQHGLFDRQTMRACVAACNACGTPCVVRVPALNEGDILHALDAGADGVMVPLIETAAEAQAAAAAAKFPPLGRRSIGSPRLMVRQGGFAYAKNANRETLLLAQIETAKGLDNVAEIAAVDGIDALLVGPADLAVSLGCTPGEPMPPAVLEDVLGKVATAASTHGRRLTAFLTDPEAVRVGMRHGCAMMAVTTDLGMLRERSRATAAEFRRCTGHG